MDNVHAWRLGEACSRAGKLAARDYIDSGLNLARLLDEAGYEVRPKPETWPFSLRT